MQIFLTNKDQIRSYMFEANVRDYQGDVTVNKEIAMNGLDKRNCQQRSQLPGSEEFMVAQ